MTRRAGFLILSAASLAVAGYALVAYGFLPLGSPVHPEMRAAFRAHPVGIYTHVFGSAAALLLGPWQFSARLRADRPGLHRWLGRLYLGVGVLLGGCAGLYMSAFAFGGLTSTLGFGLLALLWLATGYLAYRAACDRRFAAHRAWMVRNFALALAAVTLRLYLVPSVALGVPFEVVYPALAWVSWVPNLAAAEWVARRGGGS